MQVTVFSTTNCGICHALMKWLDKQTINYTKKVVDIDEAAMDSFMTLNEGAISTPFTVIEDGEKVTKIAGFDQPNFKKALGL